MATVEEINLASDVLRYLGNIRRDILANLSRYEARVADGEDAQVVFQTAQQDAANYLRLLDRLATKVTESETSKTKVTNGLEGMGVSFSEAEQIYNDNRSAAQLQADATSPSELQSAATQIRSMISDFERLA